MLDTIWLEAKRQLRTEIQEKDFEAWIEPLRATRWSGGELTVEAPSGFFRDWLKRNFLLALEQAVTAANGGKLAAVTVLVNKELDLRPRRPAAPARPHPRTRTEVVAPGRYTFDNFVVGASNQVAYRAARAVVERPGARFNPLFLYGGVGLGKTHLLLAVAGALTEAHGRVACLSAENFVNEMIGALQGDRMEKFRRRFRGIETLVIDDIQFLAGKRRSQEEFCHTFNALHDGRKQIVLASDRAPQEMPGIEETLRNRFASGLRAEIQAPDAALRLALVRSKAADLGLVLATDVAVRLAEGWCRNVRELEGVLTRIEAFSSLAGRTIDLALVREALGSPTKGSKPDIERIIGEVCEHFGLSRTEIASPRRTARVAVPRQLAMYLCRHHTEAPLDKIGAQLGGRDHSTVSHALGAIERRLRDDLEFRGVVTKLQARLGA